MGSKGVVWRPIATIAAAVGDVELEDQVLRLSRYLGYAKVLLNNFYFLGGGPALKIVIGSASPRPVPPAGAARAC